MNKWYIEKGQIIKRSNSGRAKVQMDHSSDLWLGYRHNDITEEMVGDNVWVKFLSSNVKTIVENPSNQSCISMEENFSGEITKFRDGCGIIECGNKRYSIEILVPNSSLGENVRVSIIKTGRFGKKLILHSKKVSPSAKSQKSTQKLTSTSKKPSSIKSKRLNHKNAGIKKLRKKAEEDAVDEVEQTTTATTSTKSQYNRSSKVKEYVKARADGNCEGCDEPAPFTSTTGEPYLHAHHVHELSDGGSDTPDTVIALCPNCHYRVHHGVDGDEYNQKLLEIVKEREENTEL